jgi:hypothetical protein
MTLFFTIIDVNDPPVLTLVLTTATVEEGEGVTFTEDVYYEFEDEDSNPLTVTWNWYVDDEQVPPEQVSDKYAFEYVPPITAEKDRTVVVKLEIIDGEHTVDIEWTVTVTNANQEPEVPTFTHDTSKKEYKEGDKITFSATAEDMDGDDLTYKWYLDLSTEVGSGPTLELTDVNPGLHKITVEVTDPSGATNTADFEFTVKKKETNGDSPGFGAVWLTLALLAAVGLAVAVRRRR